MFPSTWFLTPSGLTMRPQSCAQVMRLTVTLPVDLLTSTSATAAAYPLERRVMASPLPLAVVAFEFLCRSRSLHLNSSPARDAFAIGTFQPRFSGPPCRADR